MIVSTFLVLYLALLMTKFLKCVLIFVSPCSRTNGSVANQF